MPSTSLGMIVPGSFYRLLYVVPLLAICVLFLISCKGKNCDPIRVTYTESEQYTEQEPYEEEVTEKVELSYQIADTRVQYEKIPGLGFAPTVKAKISVMNTSDVEGVFTFTATLRDDESTLTNQPTANVFGQARIAPGQTVQITGQGEAPRNTFKNLNKITILEPKIISPIVNASKPITKYRSVTKIRETPRERYCYPCKENCDGYNKN